MEEKYRISYKLSNSENAKRSNETYQESAASVTDIDPYKFGKSSSKHDQERKRRLTRLLLTTLSAILIGTTFGVIFLYIFSREDVPATNQSNENPQTEDVVPGDSDRNEELKELSSLSGFVIQAGVFQELDQAKITQESLFDKGYQSIIWDTDNDYRVFISIYESEVEAKQISEQLKESDIDVYARVWQSDGGTLELSEEEIKWLDEFQTLWKNSLTHFSSEVAQAWTNWLDIEAAEMTEPLQSFHQHVSTTINQLTESELPHYLLVLLYHYQQLI